MYINYFRLCNISGCLHPYNPFTSAANLLPTASKSAMFLLRRLFETATSRYIKYHVLNIYLYNISIGFHSPFIILPLKSSLPALRCSRVPSSAFRDHTIDFIAYLTTTIAVSLTPLKHGIKQF